MALTALMLFWRAHLALTNAPLPSRWAVAGVLMVAAGAHAVVANARCSARRPA